MKKTENGYLLIQVDSKEKDKEKILGVSSEGYKATVILDEQDYKAGEIIFVTKAGLLTVDAKSLIYAIHKDRVVGRF